MGNADDTAPKVVETSYQSSWENLRAAAVKEGTKFSKTDIKPASLLGVYYAVWDSDTKQEIADDIGEEESWIKLSIKNPKNLENVSFADIEDDDDGKEPWGFDASNEAHEKMLTRVANDFGLACLVTLDSAGSPFFEMLYNSGESSSDPGSPDYVRVIWKKQKEGCRGLLMLSHGEARRLVSDGAADLLDSRDFEDDDLHDDTEEDAEGDSDEESQFQSNSQPVLKRRVEDDEEGPEVKRHKKWLEHSHK